MAKKATAPRIDSKAAEFYPGVFSSLNAGMIYVIEAFPDVYRRTLHGLRGQFARGELMLLIDVFNATMLTPGHAGQHLLIQVEDGIDLDKLDEKWGVTKGDLVAKIERLPLFSLACLEIWANGFWYRQTQPKEFSNEEFEAWIAQLL